MVKVSVTVEERVSVCVTEMAVVVTFCEFCELFVSVLLSVCDGPFRSILKSSQVNVSHQVN